MDRYPFSMIKLRGMALRHGRRSAVLILLGFLVATLLLAHSAMGMGHDSDEGDNGMQTAISVCLAVVQVGGAMLLVAAVPGFSVHRRRRFDRRRTVSPRLLALPAIAGSARAGPAALQVFRL